METLKFEDIQPLGNFKDLLITFRKKADEVIAKCDEKKAFNKSLANLIKMIVGDFGVVVALEDGIITGKGWDIDEMKKCLLYTHLIILDLNQTAHKYLNPTIELGSRIEQLQQFIDNGDQKVFGKLKLI
jgi:hypothetical protein